MIKKAKSAILLFIGLSLFASCSPDNSRADDMATIESQITRLEIALSDFNPDGYAEIYTSDGDVIIMGGPHVSGKQAIYDDIEANFDFQRSTGATSNPTRLEIQSIKFLTDDVAVVDCVSSSTGARATYIMQREGSNWLIASGRVLPPIGGL